ncbi:MAG: DUF2325 domain-containing protein [Thermomicrobiales bacterium]
MTSTRYGDKHDSPGAKPDILTNAYTLIGAGKLDRVLDLLAKELRRPQPKPEALDLFLILCIEIDDPATSGPVIQALLDDDRGDPSPHTQVRLLIELLEHPVPGREQSGEREILMRMVEIALIGADEAWSDFERETVRMAIIDCLIPPSEAFPLAALLIFAPERLGWKKPATQSIVLAAKEEATTAESIRDAERILHEAGESEEAYALERRRKGMLQSSIGDERPEHPAPVAGLSGLNVVIAGGHPAFRSMVRSAVQDEGGSLREIPPHFESVRRERDVSDILTSADVVVVIVSQIAHSTTDQVNRVARRHGIPVLRCGSASVATIVNEVKEWARSRDQAET